MICNFCKSLDRPVNIFGLKGKWLTVFMIIAGISVVFGIIAGFIAGSGVGVSVALIGCVAAFLGIYTTQGKITHRDLGKIPLADKCSTYVRRQETLCRIVLGKDDSPSWFAQAQRARDREVENNSSLSS